MTISIHMPSGIIKISPRNINFYAQWLSQYLVPISLTYMLSDNLNAYAVNNIQIRSVKIIIQKRYGKLIHLLAVHINAHW